MTITLTPEQIRLLEAAVRAGDQTIRLENPGNCRTYRLIEDPTPGSARSSGEVGSSLLDAPEMIRRSHAAFLRGLPELLENPSLRGQWVGYRDGERIGIASDEASLRRECARRGFDPDQCEVFVIEETEEVECPSSWLS